MDINQTCKELYNKAKAIVKKDTCMKIYSKKEPLYLEADASGVSLGAGLDRLGREWTAPMTGTREHDITPARAYKVQKPGTVISREKLLAYWKD